MLRQTFSLWASDKAPEHRPAHVILFEAARGDVAGDYEARLIHERGKPLAWSAWAKDDGAPRWLNGFNLMVADQGEQPHKRAQFLKSPQYGKRYRTEQIAFDSASPLRFSVAEFGYAIFYLTDSFHDDRGGLTIEVRKY